MKPNNVYYIPIILFVIGAITFSIAVNALTNVMEEQNSKIDTICNKHNMERYSIHTSGQGTYYFCMDKNGQMFLPEKLK